MLRGLTVKQAAGYLRVSTDAQAGADRYGLDSQRADIVAFAQSNGYEVKAWYTDAGLSGASLNRAGLQSLILEAAHVDAVIVAKLDRLSRDVGQQWFIRYKLLQINPRIQVVSVAEPFDDTDPAGRLYGLMIGAFAQYERDMITARMSGGRKAKARTGGYAGGGPALGYTASRGSKALTLDPVGAETVRRVFALRSSGMSMQAVAVALNSQGVLTAAGALWHKSQVKRVLDRVDLYSGRYTYSGIEAAGQQAAILGQGA
jgi:site-specific DNA recombinase